MKYRKEKMHNLLSVVIPTYKEAENIRLLIPQINQVLKSIHLKGEIIIVDDNSKDGIVDIVQTFNSQYKNINLIVRIEKHGIATAWLEGIQTAKGDKVVIMDADLCHDPNDFQLMLEKLNDCDMVIGSRHIPGEKVRMPGKSFIFDLVSEFGQLLFRWIFKLDIYDTSHSFRMFSRKVLLNTVNDLRFDGNVMMIEFTIKAIKAGMRVTEVPVTYGKRQFGKTKLKLFEQGLLFLKALVYLRFLNK